MSFPYEDIVNLPHHVSATRPKMSMINRAAQFSPFAALTGHDSAIQETARLTDGKIELSQDAIDALNVSLVMLANKMDSHPVITVTHYRADRRKSGGAYITTTGAVKKLDDFERVLVMESGQRIGITDICELDLISV